jgi:disulfide bond formation protein DsbB
VTARPSPATAWLSAATVVTAVATVERRPAVWRTALPLVAVGLPLAAYHSYLRATMTQCAVGGPCATVQWRSPLLGLTAPNLSLVAFGLLAVALLGLRRRV